MGYHTAFRDEIDGRIDVSRREASVGATTACSCAPNGFPRHRHDTFVGHVLAALHGILDAHPGDDDSSGIR